MAEEAPFKRKFLQADEDPQTKSTIGTSAVHHEVWAAIWAAKPPAALGSAEK
jgi:hypothetical protein